MHPVAFIVRTLLVPEIRGRAGEQTHPLDEGNPAAFGLPLQCMPVLDGFTQSVPVYLDPLALEQHQAVLAAEQRIQLFGRQRGIAQGDTDVEVQHRAGVEHRWRPGTDRHRHLGPGPAAPPVRQPHRQPALLELRRTAQQPVGTRRRPGHGPIDVAGVHQIFHPVAGLGRLLHRREQLDERGAILRSRVLLQRLAQRQVLQPARRAEAGGIGRHEGERTRLVVPVLGQVEADPPHLMPFRRPPLQEGGQPTGARDGPPCPAVQAFPDALQCLFAEVLAAVHGRCGQDPVSTVGVGQALDLEALRILGNVAQAGEIALCEPLPITQARYALGRNLVRREGEESLAPVGLEGAMQWRRSGRRALVPGRLPAQVSRGCQSYGHAPFSRTVPGTRRSRLVSARNPDAAQRPLRRPAADGSPTHAPPGRGRSRQWLRLAARRGMAA